MGEAVLVAMAASFTYDATVTVTNGWSHIVRVEVGTSGGAGSQAEAQGTAGADFSYKAESSTTDTFTSHSKPAELRWGTSFRKDTFSDGSERVYATGYTNTQTLVVGDYSWQLPDDVKTYEVSAGVENVTKSQTETSSAGLHWDVGVAAFGVGLGIDHYSTGARSTRSTIAFDAPGTYYYYFFGGSGDDGGMIGAVWKRS